MGNYRGEDVLVKRLASDLLALGRWRQFAKKSRPFPASIDVQILIINAFSCNDKFRVIFLQAASRIEWHTE